MRSCLRPIGWFLTPLVLAGCLVRESRYDQAVQQMWVARDEASQSRQNNDSLRAKLDTTQAQLQAQQTKAAEFEATAHNLQARLDEATALHQLLEKELERLGKNVGAMLKDKGAMQQALDDAKFRLAELRTMQAAAEARRGAMTVLAGQLSSLQETKRIELVSQDGEKVMLIPRSLLFEPGRFETKHSAGRVLEALARVLARSPGLHYQIKAYSPVPANKGHARAVFELGALRASKMADHLLALGLAPSSLSIESRVYSTSEQESGPVERADDEPIQIGIVDVDSGAGATCAAVMAPGTAPPTASKGP